MSSTLDTDLCTSLLSSPTRTTHPSSASSQQQQSQQQQQQGSAHPTGDTKPSDAATARAMSQTGAWKPALDRRQSWDSQEWKHDLQKRLHMATAGSGTGASGGTGAGQSQQGTRTGQGTEVAGVGGRQGPSQGFTEA